MKQKNLALKAARYLIFETLEVLLIPATAGLFLLGQGGAVYLFAASRETFMYQEILPGAEEGMSLIFIGLFLLAWIFVFYFWRRRAGLRRLIGQLAAVLLSAAAALLWTGLAVFSMIAASEVFFVAIPCVLAAMAWTGTVFALLPIRSLIRWQRAQRELLKNQNSMNSQ